MKNQSSAFVRCNDKSPGRQYPDQRGTVRFLRDGPIQNTVFLVHSVTGGTGCYDKVVASVETNNRVVAINAPGVENRELSHESIAALGHTAACTIRELQPAGPYIVCGYSMGGFVAYEAVRTLKQVWKEEISLLSIVDSNFVVPVRPRLDDRTLWLTFSSAMGCASLERMKASDVFWTQDEGVRLENLYISANDDSQIRIKKLSLQEFKEYFDYFASMWALHPVKDLLPLDVPSQYLYTAEAERRGFATRWRKILGCDGVLLPGTHISIMWTPHSAEWGRQLTQTLRKSRLAC